MKRLSAHLGLAMTRIVTMMALTGAMLLGVASSPSRAEVKYLTEGPGFIEITGDDYDLWRAGNLVPRPNLPNGACVPVVQGGCHCPNANASGTVTTERRIVLLASFRPVCPAAGTLIGRATVTPGKREQNMHGFTEMRFGPDFTEWRRENRTEKKSATIRWEYKTIPQSLTGGQKVIIQVTGGVVAASPADAADGIVLSGVVAVWGDVDVQVAQQADRGHPVGRYEFTVRPNARAVEIHIGGAPAGTGAIWKYGP